VFLDELFGLFLGWKKPARSFSVFRSRDLDAPVVSRGIEKNERAVHPRWAGSLGEGSSRVTGDLRDRHEHGLERFPKCLSDLKAFGKIQNSRRMPWHRNGAFDPSIRASEEYLRVQPPCVGLRGEGYC
jgi:hypothetical protein